ncbi:MAG: lysylphosphatidylglycerol synthase domain-containing protein [Pseudomonadota bacterium]
MPLSRHLDRRVLLLGGGTLALLLVLAVLVRGRLEEAAGEVASADPRWLWTGAACFVALILATAMSWRAGIAACGGRIGCVDSGGRYAVGSLVNGIAPAGAGGAVRIGLYSRRLPERDRILTATGIAAAIGFARAPSLAALVVAAAALGAFALWPLLLLAGGFALAVAIAWGSRRWVPHARLAHVLDAFRALAQCPRRAVSLAGWVTLATAARVAGAMAVAASVGLDRPVVAGLVMVPAMCLASAVPSTPGNVGVTSGAVAMALSLVGVGFEEALAVGIAFHAVETLVSIAAGLVGLLVVARPQVRVPGLRFAGTGAGIAFAAVLSLLVA